MLTVFSVDLTQKVSGAALKGFRRKKDHVYLALLRKSPIEKMGFEQEREVSAETLFDRFFQQQ